MLTGKDISVLRRATVTAIAFVTLLTLLVSYVFYRQNLSIIDARDWVNHTYEVKGHIQELQGRLRDAVGSARTYMFTNDETFLVTYYDATRQPAEGEPRSDDLNPHLSIAEEIVILRRQTIDNKNQASELDAIDKTSREMIDFLAIAIDKHKKQSLSPLSELDPRPTRQYLDRLREMLNVMTVEENNLLVTRNDTDVRSIRETNQSIFTCIGLFYVIMVSAIWFYQRTRQIAQTELLIYTRQLKQSEEELKASHEEIEASNEELEEQNAQIRQHTEELRDSKRLVEEKAREVELGSKYKTEFLANMSHELRTPLNSLLILSRSLSSNEDGNLTDEQIEEATIIHNDGLELLNLINDILDLSKVEAGKLSVVVDEVEVAGILQRLQKQFDAIAKDHKVDFPVETAGSVPTLIHTDTHRLEQILKNLLSNAFKFTKSGSVTLRAYRPDVTAIQRTTLLNGENIAFSVIDTGIGINPSRFKDIFEAFQQEDGSTDRNYGGTGLGLTIARKFAHLLGGEIHVQSKKGFGSSFTLILPTRLIASPGSPPDQITPQLQSAISSPKPPSATDIQAIQPVDFDEFLPDDRRLIGTGDRVLLIVEDDRNFALTLMKIARKRGYKCVVAGAGKTALLLANELPVSAIILDLKLPDINGRIVLDMLKQDVRLRHIPVHIISGADGFADRPAVPRGAIGYLTKPAALEGIDVAFARIESLRQENVRRILVVEDEKDSQVAINKLLDRKNIAIVFADTGEAGLVEFKDSNFDCVILDLKLPDMTGYEWLAAAEQLKGLQGLPPIIVYTAFELTKDQTRALHRYTTSIIIKDAKSPEHLLDEATLFLHSIESSLPKEQRDMIRMRHHPDRVLQGRSILLVDDDLRNTFALSKLLKKRGLKVIIADNGRLALDKLCEDDSIELIIMDIMMPVMDGYQAMREIRASKRFSSLPIIALTARAMPEEQEKCLEAGANDYMTKPVDTERLLTLLRVWLFWQESAL